MKIHKLVHTVLGLLWGCSAMFAQPLPPDQVVFDEFGNATMNGTPLTCSKQADPGPGGKNSVLFCAYAFTPGTLATGDLIVYDSDMVTISDVVRFATITIPGIGSVAGFFIYSENSTGVTAPADVGLPTQINTNSATTTETGPPGQNGGTYSPDYGQPGFFFGADEGIVYTFTSDQLPPTISKVFGSSALQLLGPTNTTTLTFTITNPGSGPFAETFPDTAFTDTLPAGLIISNPNGLSPSTCGGGTITAVANTNFIQLTGALLA